MVLLVVLSLAPLFGWIVFFRKKKYSAILIFSILLVIFGLPPLFFLNKVFTDGGIYDSTQLFILLFLLFLGVGYLALGAYGIIYSAIAMSKKSAN